MLGRREIDHEAGATSGSVLDPYRAVVASDVLRHQSQAQPGAGVGAALPGAGAAGEPLEHPLPQLFGNPGAPVVDFEPKPPTPSADCDPHSPAAVPSGVVEQVADHPLQPSAVAAEQRG